MTMLSRCLAYERKYGYRVEDYFSFETRMPFSLEKNVGDRIAHLRVAGNVRGDSIEWYRITPEELKILIVQTNRDLIAST